jgi:hypothetical protein
MTIAAAGFGGGFAYKRLRRYLDERKLRKKREESGKARKEQKAKSSVRKRSAQKRPRTRKKTATKSKRNRGKGISEIEGKAARAAAKE